MNSTIGHYSFSPQCIHAGSTVHLGISIKPEMTLSEGAIVRIEFPWGGWTPPVLSEIRAHEYLQNVNSRVKLYAQSSDVRLIPRVWYRGVLNPFIDMKVQNGNLVSGDEIVFDYGVENSQLVDTVCQNFPTESTDFKVFFNPSGEENGELYPLTAEQPLVVFPNDPNRLEIIIPTICIAGNKINAELHVTDQFRNAVDDLESQVFSLTMYDGSTDSNKEHVWETQKRNIQFSPDKSGVLRLAANGACMLNAVDSIIPLQNYSTLDFLPIPRKAGGNSAPPIQIPEIWIKGASRYSAISGPSKVFDSDPGYRLYWGDLHGHTTLSDGVGDIEQFYKYARQVAALDIAAASDHEGGIELLGLPKNDRRPPMRWEKTQNAANTFYEPGKFVTFRGFEWTSCRYGHRNVYFRDGKVRDYFGAFTHEYILYDMEPTEFYTLIDDPDALIIPHHTLVATDWKYYDPRELLVEIYSTWGRTEFSGNKGWDKPDNPGTGVQAGLDYGYRMGIIGGGDSHDSMIGRCYPGSPAKNLNYRSGLMGVFAAELTRNAVFEALQKRRTFATTGERCYLDFRINNNFMGSEITVGEDSNCSVFIEYCGTRPIRTVELVSNNGKVTKLQNCIDEMDIQLEWKVKAPHERVTDYYYVRVEQSDGNIAWSSPIWVSLESQR